MVCLDCCSSISCGDCCSSISCGDCCSSISCGDCCSMSGGGCPDCFSADSFLDDIKDWLKSTLTIKSGSDYVLQPASRTSLGGVKVGDKLSVGADGLLSADKQTFLLDTIAATVEGSVWINDIVESVGGGATFNEQDVKDIFG